MEQPLLDVAMIVKNEEHFLPGCLESISAMGELVHEVCIYDTGSSDRTIEIAEKWGARVERGYWDDDFSRARNEAVRMCAAKWVLSLDADERVHGNRFLLGRLLREGLAGFDGGADVYRLDWSNRDTQDREVYCLPADRIFRPTRGVFKGRIHETVQARDESRGWSIRELPRQVLFLSHHGYNDPLSWQERSARNVRIATKEGRADSFRGFDAEYKSKMDLARSLLMRQDDLHAWEALKDVRTNSASAGRRAWAGEYMAEVLLARNDWAEAAVLARQLRDEGVSSDNYNWIVGRARLGEGRFADAFSHLRSIQRPIDAAGARHSLGEVLLTRARAAAQCGERDEALASLVAAMGKHGMGAGYGKLLLSLWGDRPLDVLARIFVEEDGGYLDRVCVELATHGPVGESLVQSISEVRGALAQAADGCQSI